MLSLKATTNNVEYVVIVTKVHNIISFNQSAWLKPYSLGNNDSKQNANHDVEQEFFKQLMNNSVFGKNVNNIIDLRLATDPKMAIKQFSMLNFKTVKYLEYLHIIEHIKQKSSNV